jgi:hypothetical protein
MLIKQKNHTKVVWSSYFYNILILLLIIEKIIRLIKTIKNFDFGLRIFFFKVADHRKKVR